MEGARETLLLFWNPGSFGCGAGVSGIGDGEQEDRLGAPETSQARRWQVPTEFLPSRV